MTMATVGAHVSVAGGLEKGIAKAEAIGARVIQIFGASPRRWSTRLPDEKTVKLYKQALSQSSVGAVYLHATYLINLATSDEIHRKKSIQNLVDHMKIATLIDADGLIFHVGAISSTSEKRELALSRAVKAMKEVLKHAKGKPHLIMENSAGGKGRIGSNLEDLAFLKKKVNSTRVKICLDTAHALEAGIIKSYTPLEIKLFFDQFDKKIGIDQLSVLHVNDSKSPYNSHRDLHENIGKGFIGIDGFKNLARELRVRNKPWILEVPGFKKDGPDKKNIEILNSCFFQ